MDSHHGKSKPGEFLPGIILPPEIHGLLRRRLSQVEVADSAVDCLIAQARAESLVEAIEVLRVIPSPGIERLYLLIEQAVNIRLAELGGQG